MYLYLGANSIVAKETIKSTSPENHSKKSQKAFEIYPKILTFIAEGKKLSVQDIEQLEETFGERVKKALELIGAKKVKKYLFTPSGVSRWVVEGHEHAYLTLEHSFCSCKDFLFSSIMKRVIPSCYHLLARELAELSGKFEEIVVADEQYTTLIEEWL